MKKVMYLLAICLFATSFSANAHYSAPLQSQEKGVFATATFKVYGNCGMCKRVIEEAAESLFGVKKATWNMKTGMLTVSYRSWAVNLNKIKQAIADVGYDSDTHRAKDSVYEGLHHCCQYERTTVK